MQKVKIHLENCYGIKSLETEFDFSGMRSFVIYAPNGIMKTSFANTFKDLSNGEASKDCIFKERETKRVIEDESGAEISKEKVFVIEPYNQGYKSAKISTLLVNKKLKEDYDKIYLEIDEKKDVLLKALKTASGLKADEIEEALSDAITHEPKEFFKSLTRVQQEVSEGKSSVLGDILYQKVFNDKVLELLKSQDFKEKLTEYMKVYDELVSASTFFKKGIFNHNNAADIAKSLKENGFFKASHSVYVNGKDAKKEIKTEAALEKVIQEEKDTILSNATLAKSFEDIDKKLNKNKDTKDFRTYIEQNKAILPELVNLDGFRQKLWIAYLIKNVDAYKNLLDVFAKGKEAIEKIIAQAKKEATKWQAVIDVFNERFSVPFKVTMENQEDVILKSEAPSIKFRFKDKDREVLVEEGDLLRILSNGEKRALYILNIIFEVQARQEAGQETLFIIDDVADSFDYKNKYAIIEYLHDVLETSNFYQIILTHNFDFYRTIGGRLGLLRENRLHTVKSDEATKLVADKYQKNPFATWKQHFDNDEMLIASIPFVRNLAEYCGYEDEEKKLTYLLHIKADTDSITIADLEAVFKKVLKDQTTLTLKNPTHKVKKLIYDTADKIYAETDEVIELEKKIVLSVAIRLKTEEFLIKKIADAAFVAGISKNQTIKLIKKYKQMFPSETQNVKLVEKVNLMTPENIHINSFMYEPILDMSNEYLKHLYEKVSALK